MQQNLLDLASLESLRESGDYDRIAALLPDGWQALVALRATARTDTSLVLVTAPPMPNEVQSLLRIGSGFGRKLAALVYPVTTTSLPGPAAMEIETRAASARQSLQHAGWDVFLIQPDGRLSEVWQATRNRNLRPVGSLS